MSERNEQVVSEALCRNHLSGFAEVCASGCGDCTFPGQPHPCEHALAVWGSDAQEILRALPAHDGVREALEKLADAAEADLKANRDEDPGGWWSLRTMRAIEAARAALSTKQEGEECLRVATQPSDEHSTWRLGVKNAAQRIFDKFAAAYAKGLSPEPNDDAFRVAAAYLALIDKPAAGAPPFVRRQSLPAALAEVLSEIEDFLQDQHDIRDGAGGQQLPNKAMALSTALKEALGERP